MKTPEEIKKGLEMCGVIRGRCKGCPYDGEAECVSNHSADALAYIQQLEKQCGKDINVPRWISVEERLPDDLEEVLILVKETEFYGQYKEFSKSYFCQYIGCVDDGEWYTVWCHGHRYIKDTEKEPYSDKLEVTHWMPLPEPPKEDT